MPTVSVNLDTTQYVKVNIGFGPMMLQAHRDEVRITISLTQPAKGNSVFHTLSGKDAPLHLNSIDTNIWALAVTDQSSLIVSETPIVILGDYFHAIAEGEIEGHSLVHKFGKADEVITDYTPLAHGSVWPTPQADSPVKLRIKAGGHIQDNQNGTGARSVRVDGISVDGSPATEILLPHATDGTLAGVDGIVDFIRIFRMHVETSGTYANQISGSHQGPIVVEETGGGDWAVIDGAAASANFPRGQSQIAAYTVPLGFTAYVYSYVLTTDSGKPVDFLFFQRDSILEIAAPYTGIMRVVVETVGVKGEHSGEFKGGQKFNELTDIGWMVKGATSTVATVDFEIVLVAN